MLSLQKVSKILRHFGLSRSEAIIYIYLAKAGPQRIIDIANGLRVPKKQLYLELKKLNKKGAVNHNSEHPTLFSAKAFEELLDKFIKDNMDQAKALKEAKEKLLINWKNYPEKQ